MSAFELEEIVLSLKFKLSTVTPPPPNVTAPVTVNAPSVDNPSTCSVPVVLKFSFPKLIAPDESVIEPFASVRLPIVEPEPAVIVPVVERFSLPKLIAPDESVIDPSARVKFPTVDPDPAVIAPENESVPDTDKSPSTTKPSLILIAVESSELNVVPEILIAPKTTDPVPAGTRLMFSLDLVPIISLPLMLIAGKFTAPEPAGLNIKSSLVLVALISFPVTCMLVRSNPADA